MKPVIVAAVVAGVVAGAVGAVVAWSVVRAKPGPGPYQRVLTDEDRKRNSDRFRSARQTLEARSEMYDNIIDLEGFAVECLNWIAQHPRANADDDIAAVRRILKGYPTDGPPQVAVTGRLARVIMARVSDSPSGDSYGDNVVERGVAWLRAHPDATPEEDKAAFRRIAEAAKKAAAASN